MRLYGLDALRGVAAVIVALVHLLPFGGQNMGWASALLAVDVFFILSGFVMARTYERRMLEGLTTPQFLRIRYRRLLPPMTIGATLGLIWVIVAKVPVPDLGWAYVLILAFMPAWWTAPQAFLLNPPTWSLFVEISANALHGVLFGRVSTKALAILWAVVTIAACAVFLYFHAGVRTYDWTLAGVLLLFPRGLSSYLIGILIYRLCGEKPLGNTPLVSLAAFVGLTLTVRINPVLELLGTFVAAPLIVRGVLGMTPSRLAGAAGALSFPLYAVHVPVMDLAYTGGLRTPYGIALAFAVAALIAGGDWLRSPRLMRAIAAGRQIAVAGRWK